MSKNKPDQSHFDLTLAVVGNPNCGKTTLFNGLTGARQRVGNWPGVTVEKKQGHYSYQGKSVRVVDLPGTYSIDVSQSGVSLDEQIARDYVLAGEADLIVNIIDASNLERNLYLTLQLLEMGRPMLVAVNMLDVAEEHGLAIDLAGLEKRLGCPVVGLVASRNQGLDELKGAMNKAAEAGKIAPVPVTYQPELEQGIAALEAEIMPLATAAGIDCRWMALKLLEGDHILAARLAPAQQALLQEQREALQATLADDLDILFVDQRYQRIAEMSAKLLKQQREVSRTLTDRIDSIVLNRMLGIPIFLLVMYLMFMFTINIGSAFIDFFDILAGTVLVDGTAHLLGQVGAPDWLVALLANGLGGGIQTVATFIPVIGCLFLFMSVLEDSGYMARAAFVMDRLMRALGLPGKSFVAMLVGFGCNVPSMMAARTLENPRDRYLTIAMAPFMSCGARLSVYALFAVAFFSHNGQNVVFALYMLGIAAAVFTGLVLRRTLLPGEVTPFVMELPPYHLPTLRGVLIRTWDRLKGFIIRAGKAIVIVVMGLSILNSIGTDGSFGNENSEKSALSAIGRTITPVFSPMGLTEDNWPATVGIFTGIFAKEAVVGTLNAMYSHIGTDGASSEDESFDLWGGVEEALASIPANLADITSKLTDPLGMDIGDVDDMASAAEEQEVDQATYGTMAALFGSTAAAFAYLVFILLYTPCVAALGAVYRETNLGWTLFVGGWTFALAYFLATLVYQVGTFGINPALSSIWIVAMLAGFGLLLLYMRNRGGIEVAVKAPVNCDNGSCSCS